MTPGIKSHDRNRNVNRQENTAVDIRTPTWNTAFQYFRSSPTSLPCTRTRSGPKMRVS